MLKQSYDGFRVGIPNEIFALRAGPGLGNEWPFHMRSGDLTHPGLGQGDGFQRADDLIERRRRRRQEKRSRAAGRMKIANRAQCLRRGFHRVTSHRSMDVQIDEPRRKIVSAQIDDLIRTSRARFPNRDDAAAFHNHLHALADPIPKNKAGVLENHRCGLIRKRRATRVRISSL